MTEINESLKKIIKLLLLISESEENLTKIKQEIVNKCDINPIQLFFLLDKDKKGFISKYNLMRYLKENNILYTKQEIDYLYFFYDKDNDGFLNFNELLNLFIPDTNYFYKMFFKKKYNNKNFETNECNPNEISIDIHNNSLYILKQELNLGKKNL